MKKDILKLFYIPILSIFIFSLIYFSFMSYLLNKESKKIINYFQERLISDKKREIKKNVKDFKIFIKIIRYSLFDYTKELMSKFLQITNYNNLIEKNGFIYGKIPLDAKLNYFILNNRYMVLNYNNKKYFVVLQNEGKNVYLAGILLSYLDNYVLTITRALLDEYNKNRISYIALTKITTRDAKNDVIGYIYYMPKPLNSLLGKELNISKPDIKGNLYIKEYFECLKNNKNCFISYYFKNPKTGVVEQKLSYFDVVDEYNLSIIKGIYKSQLEKEFLLQWVPFKREIFKLIKLSILVYVILIIGLVVLFFHYLSKIKYKLLSEYEKMKKEIIKRYYFDLLTHLPNRLKLIEDIDKLEPISLLILDIKEFGIINELYGFEFGNKILKGIADKLKQKFKYVYKFGNDEFAILNVDLDCINFRKALSFFEHFYVEDLKLEFNCGIANDKPFIENAEMALYKAKSLDVTFFYYDKQIEKEYKQNFEKVLMLKSILERKNIIPYYQCIVDKDRKIVKYEALMRLKNEKGEILSPFLFMKEIKKLKLYEQFSLIMIKKVIEDVKKFKFNVSINLSFEDIENDLIKEYVLNLDRNILKFVTFEILESESIKSYEIINEFLNVLKQKGSKIAIDDFGSGYSNFVHILNLKTDYIKIDGSLIKNINYEKYRKIIEFIVSFSKDFNIKIVAEFVENEIIFKTLKKMNIDYFQGYYFCKPKPIEEIFDKIASKKV